MLPSRLLPIIVLFGILLGANALGKDNHGSHTFTDCGGVFDQPTGVIQTPNFPDRYPTPIYCEWLIKAPQSKGKKIIIYFTQYYMKDSLYITSYEAYVDRTTHLGQRDLGRFSWEHDIVSVAAYQPFVLLQFSVESIGNRHVRVMDFLLDVYGFNITYEIVDRATDVTTKPTCSMKECSYLGNCLAAADFSKYECECFPEFFGDHCQYGPYCQPDKNINQCHNGGKCKYFFGSLINQCECPPEYAGAYCEIHESGKSMAFEKDCLALNCSQVCDVSERGELFCTCHEGYQMHDDNETCKPTARYRIDVHLELATFMAADKLQADDIEDMLYERIKFNGVSTIDKYEIKGFRNASRTTVLDFHFYCMVSEVGEVHGTLQKLIDFGTLGNLPLLQTRPKYEESPELMLAEVANYDPSPTLRGNLLTLVCAAKGSSNLSFRWIKDGYQVNTNLTSRNAWEAIIPHTVQGMQLSVLNIDNISPLDAGQFMCLASDFGETQMAGVEVNVNNYPRVQLYPMSLSVLRGQSISITCLSPDDCWFKCRYEWFKNNIKIEGDSDSEYMEGMRPTGVRLVVTSVKAHAEYTCKVTNEAGSANVTAYVHMFSENETELFCPRNYEGQVMWHNTSGGHFDIKPCPTEQGVDDSQYGPLDIGYAQRDCVCDSTTSVCSWMKPNFAKCQSLILVEIYDSMQRLRFGYQSTTLLAVFRELHQIMVPRHAALLYSGDVYMVAYILKDLVVHMMQRLRFGYQSTTLLAVFQELHQIMVPRHAALLYSGDVDMVAHILKDLVVHMRHYPELAKKHEAIRTDELVEMVGVLLERSATATPDEKALIIVGTNIIIIVNNLLVGAIRYLHFTGKPTASCPSVDMTVIPMERQLPAVTENNEGYRVIGHSVEKRSQEQDSEKTNVDVLSFGFDHLSDLLTYRERSKTNRPYLKLVSRLHSLGQFDAVKPKILKPVKVRVTLEHTEKIDVTGSNTTTCLSWNYDTSNLYLGDWSVDTCTVVTSASTRTTCDCSLPGHFVVAVVHSNRTFLGEPGCSEGNLLLVVVGYSLALIFVLIAFMIFVKMFRQLVAEIYTVHLISVSSLTLATVIDLLCIVHLQKPEAVQILLVSVLIYLYFVMFTAILAEGIQLFIVSFGKQKLVVTKLKFVIGCLGFPAILLIPTIIVSQMFDSGLQCHQTCWFSSRTWQFYAFILPVIALVVCFLTLVGLSIWKLHKWNEEWRYADKVQNMKSCGKATFIMILLAVTIMTSLDLEFRQMTAQPTAHVIFYVALRFSVLLFRCFLDKQIRFLILMGCFGSPDGAPSKMMKSSSSFRAFVKPERVQNDTIQEEEYNVSKYYDEINRTKYNVDRTRQLSSLLGSSVCSGESSDTRSTTVTGTGSTLSSSKESEVRVTSSAGGVNNWSLNGHAGYSKGISKDASNTQQQLVKVSSFIRSDDDDVRETANGRIKSGNPALKQNTPSDSEKKQSIPIQRNPPIVPVSAQYVKKSNTCSITTPHETVREEIPSYQNKLDTIEDINNSPRWVCGENQESITSDSTDAADEYHVLIQKAIDLQANQTEDQGIKLI